MVALGHHLRKIPNMSEQSLSIIKFEEKAGRRLIIAQWRKQSRKCFVHIWSVTYTRYHARKMIEGQPTLAYSSVYVLKDCQRYCLQQLQARHDVASDITRAISLQLSFICWYK